MLTISELGRIAGTTPRAIRHYERIGLLPPAVRLPGGAGSVDEVHVGVDDPEAFVTAVRQLLGTPTRRA